MAANIEESIIEKLRGLPLEKQREVLEFVENLAMATAQKRDDRPSSRLCRKAPEN